MPKTILYSEEARKAMERGVDALQTQFVLHWAEGS